jgi:hypothetical protein
MASQDIVAGWDVAGWKGTHHALAVASSQPNGLQWLQLVGPTGVQPIVDVLHAQLQHGNLFLGIDAPLSYPPHFVAWLTQPQDFPLGAQALPTLADDLALRAIDRWLHTQGLRPLTASMSYLGAPATLAMHIARHLRTRHRTDWLPVDAPTRKAHRSALVETYPAAFKRLTAPQHAWVTDTLPPPVRDAYQALYVHKTASKRSADNHLLDACLCTLVAHSLQHPQPQLPIAGPLAGPAHLPTATEGWIYCPLAHTLG